MTEKEIHLLTHTSNKSIGEWEFRFDRNWIEQLPAYQITLIFLNSFIWARFESARLEGRHFDKLVSSLNEFQEISLDKEIEFATLSFTGLYNMPKSFNHSEYWIKNSYKIEFYNEKNNSKHPFICLIVYPQLYKSEVLLAQDKVFLGESSQMNLERFNFQFKRLRQSLNAEVSVCGSELGYKVSEDGLSL